MPEKFICEICGFVFLDNELANMPGHPNGVTPDHKNPDMDTVCRGSFQTPTAQGSSRSNEKGSFGIFAKSTSAHV